MSRFSSIWDLMCAFAAAKDALLEVVKYLFMVGFFLAFVIVWRDLDNIAIFNKKRIDALEGKIATAERLKEALEFSLKAQEINRQSLQEEHRKTQTAVEKMQQEHKSIMKMVYESDKLQRQQLVEIHKMVTDLTRKK